MEAPRILIVDDCADSRALARRILESCAEVETAGSLTEAEASLAAGVPDLVVLDLELPDGSGFDLCRSEASRHALSDAVIVLVSAHAEAEATVEAFALGIDDVLRKPYAPSELRARVDARLRDRKRRRADALHFGLLALDPNRLRATVEQTDRSEELPLTPIEFRLLLCLAGADGRVRSRGELISTAWSGVVVAERTVDTHVGNLRAKLRGSCVSIEAVRGSGYRLQTA